jgi:hypothetical protein
MQQPVSSVVESDVQTGRGEVAYEVPIWKEWWRWREVSFGGPGADIVMVVLTDRQCCRRQVEHGEIVIVQSQQWVVVVRVSMMKANRILDSLDKKM